MPPTVCTTAILESSGAPCQRSIARVNARRTRTSSKGFFLWLGETVADPAAHFGGDQRRARAEERIVDCLAGPAVVGDRPAHALDRLLRAVPGAFFALP